ncbi:exopolysaccharide transport family protein [Chelativorans sp. AA-79]|uniref:GumC family protein n=1 Tax=Chelativorans sp. AA-79 TaxID=3028735 RepID=UPI0023F8625A|nr:exopolysaccharide transport family protein [Chelativorans sp. AA-79]WEX11595.1 exopolysaccharide transport family protein [Chelativorans sp. AA-79]
MKKGEVVADDVDVDLDRLFASLRRDWRRILLVALAVAALVFVLASLATPLYRAETRVLIEVRESVYTRPQGAAVDERTILDQQGVASQVQVITSTDILTQVARELDLANHEEFAGTQPSLLDRLLMALGLKRDSGTPPEQRLLSEFRENLSVYQVENSRVIVIEFSSADPELAARVPNAVADAYVASLKAAESQSNADATRWLEPEIAELREKVRAAEAEVAEFRGSSDLLVGQNNTVLATQQLAELSSELSRVRADRSASEARAESVRAALERGASVDSMPEVLASGMIQRLRERQIELRAQIADLSTTLLGNHPRIRALQSQLADLDGQIRAEAGKILEGLEAEAETARRRETELTAELERLKAASARAGEQQVELRALEREAAGQRELLESYLARYREAAARGERDYLPVDARVFSRAIVPLEPYYPKVLPLTLAALAAALLAMVIVTLLRELFSGRAMRPAGTQAEPEAAPSVFVAPPPTPEADATPAVKDPAPGEDEAPAPAIAQAAPAATPAVASPGPRNTLGEVGIDMAAEALISRGIARAIFVSPEGDEAAAAAVLVAREVADAGLRVILLDLTLSGAATQPMLESRAYPGITNLLASEAQFADVIHGDLYSGCHVIPVGTADPERAMRAFDRLPIIMNSLAIAYDVVVVECGAADAGVVQSLMDEDAQVLVSVLDPEEKSVSATAAQLRDEGLGKPILVTPMGYVPPAAPPDRDAA